MNGNKSNIPKYSPQDCELCGIWGHETNQCRWIHTRFPHLVINYAQMKDIHNSNTNANVNITTHTKLQENNDKNNNNNSHKSDNNNKNDNNSNSNNGWYNPNN